jgi:hypothetical protein
MKKSLEKNDKRKTTRNATGFFTAKLDGEDLALTDKFIQSVPIYFGFGGSKKVGNIETDVQFLTPPEPATHNNYGPEKLIESGLIITEYSADGGFKQTIYVPIDGEVEFDYELKENHYHIKGMYNFKVQIQDDPSAPVALEGEFELKAREYVLPPP